MMRKCFKLLLTAMALFSIAVPAIARDTEKTKFLSTLFKGENYPVALAMSESYPWVADGQIIKAKSRQADEMSNSWFSLDVFVPEDSATVSFDYNVKYHKEQWGYAKYATLSCAIDGEVVFSNNGTDKTEKATIKIDKGYHTLKWNLYLGQAWENYYYFASMENMVFDGISDECSLPEFSCQSVMFNNTELNHLKQESVEIENIGSLPLYINSSIERTTSPFNIGEGESLTILSGETGKIVIGFEPEYEGFDETEIMVASNSAKHVIPVRGISTKEYMVYSPKPGGLSSVLTDTDCESVIILGHLNRDDQYHLNKLQKCLYLNLAGTDIEVVTNGGLNNLWKLQTIVLPKSLKVLDTTWTNSATYDRETGSWIYFYDLTTIQCLSTHPPKVYDFYGEGGDSEEKSLGNLRETTRLLVPEEGLSEYINNPIWSKLTVIPANQERTTLRAKLDIEDVAPYQGMALVLYNCDTRETNTITLNESKEYSFFGLCPYYRYELILKDLVGRVLGKTEEIMPQDQETFITLSAIKKLLKVDCYVYDDEHKDVTEDVVFEWVDENGRSLSDSYGVNSVLEGDSLMCKLTLTETLGREFMSPDYFTFRAEGKDTTLVCQLKRIQNLSINGVLMDAVYKEPIKKETILFNQYLNGIYSTTTKAITDADGRFACNLKNDSTIISIVMQDYEPYKRGFTNLNYPEALSEVWIQPQHGVPVNVSFSYQPSVVEGDVPTITNWYKDYLNVRFTAKNLTTGQTIEKTEYNWPTLKLLENCAVGDSLSIIIESITENFYPIEMMCVIDNDGRGEVSVPVIELGSIRADYKCSDNSSTTGLLFGPDMRLLKSGQYHASKISFDNLKDGKYSLVTMGSNELYNSMSSLNSLRDYQLKEGKDYVITELDVREGLISVASIDSIPHFDNESHLMTSHSSYFTVNRSSVVAGNYVTVDARIGFIPVVEEKVKDVTLCLEIPDGTVFVKNSLLLGGLNSNGYTLDGNKLTIQVSKLDEKIRFCLQPLTYGDFRTTGNVKFKLDEDELTQPIGAISFFASSVTINVPSTTPFKQLTVSGNTLPNAEVTLFDDNVFIGRADASGSGVWKTQVELDNPYNMSRHRIHAKIKMSDGTEMKSEVKEVLYDKNQIAVNKVTMYHDNPEVGKTFEVEFDFINPSSVTSSYTYYIYNRNFTFTIDLTDNNPDIIEKVILWVETGKGNEIALDAEFDENQGCWIASGQFGNMYDGDIPVNVSVSLRQKPITEIDSEAIEANWQQYTSYVNELMNINNFYDDIIGKIQLDLKSETPDFDHVQNLLQMISDEYTFYIDESEEDNAIEDNTIEDCLAEMKNLEEVIESNFDRFLPLPNSVYEKREYKYGNIIITTEIAPYSDYVRSSGESSIVLPTTDGGLVEIINKDDSQTILDRTRNFYISYTFSYSNESNNVSPMNIWKTNENSKSIVEILAEEAIKRWDEIAQNLTTAYLKSLEKAYAESADRLLEKAMKDIKDEASNTDNIVRVLPQHREAVKLIKMIREISNSATIFSKTMCRIIASFQEENALLATIDRLPALSDCAMQLYPEESAEVMETLTALIKSLKNDRRHKIIVPTVSQVGSPVSTFFAGIAADAYAEELGKTEWYILDQCIEQILALNSACQKEELQRLINEGLFKSNCPNAPTQIDPSGYVYESVPSNRLPGVKATCYQKVESENMYGDIIEKAVLWCARDFEQENPLYTDENGMYRWDVPEGLWQVKFEKDGYQTVCTEWLPVPPPQLDINIPMVQATQPSIKKAEWTSDGIEIHFDKYMLPNTINGNSITVQFDTINAFREIILLDEERLDDREDISYASAILVKLNNIQFDKNDIIDLNVKGTVKSYAGVPMGNDQSFRLSLIPTITEYIVADSISLPVNETSIIHIHVKSQEAASGKMLNVNNSSPLVCTVQECVILDKNGEADIHLTGNMAGSATISLWIEGYQLIKRIPVTIVKTNERKVETPYASVNDNEVVELGTEVHLFCKTEGASIYYTLDSGCPCDIESRVRYNGTPIVLEKDTELKVMGIKPGFEDSDIATYHFNVSSSIECVENSKHYSVSPKVTNDYVYLNLNGSIASRVTVMLFDGKVIQSETNVPDGSRINLIGLPSGIYFLNIAVDGSQFTEKILKR